MPPTDIWQGGQLYDQLLFQLVHIAVLRRIQRTGVNVGMADRVNRRGQAERGLADNALRFQPLIKGSR